MNKWAKVQLQLPKGLRHKGIDEEYVDSWKCRKSSWEVENSRCHYPRVKQTKGEIGPCIRSHGRDRGIHEITSSKQKGIPEVMCPQTKMTELFQSIVPDALIHSTALTPEIARQSLLHPHMHSECPMSQWSRAGLTSLQHPGWHTHTHKILPHGRQGLNWYFNFKLFLSRAANKVYRHIVRWSLLGLLCALKRKRETNKNPTILWGEKKVAILLWPVTTAGIASVFFLLWIKESITRQVFMLLLLLSLHPSSQSVSSSSFQVQFESQLTHKEKQLTVTTPFEFPSLFYRRHTGHKGHGEAVSSTTVPEQAKVWVHIHHDM